MNNIEIEINYLVEYLNYHSYCYYILNRTEIPDVVFDRAFRKLELLEEENPSYVRKDSPTQRVGYPINVGYPLPLEWRL